MKPEAGDRSVQVRSADVCKGFRDVGAKPGDVLMYHGSLSSMGTVIGGPDTVIKGARLAVGREGTVAMPSLWYHDADPPLDPADWDIHTSESYVGALSEAFRGHPDSVRSDNFSHAVSAIGARARELVANHGEGGERHSPWGPKAFADVSPWARLVEWNALYCFIGVTFRVLTLKHYMEALILQEVMETFPEDNRETAAQAISRIGKPGIWPFFNSETMEQKLAEKGLVAYAKIGSATIRAGRTQDLMEHGMPLLRESPEEWFSKEFMAWWEKWRR